MTDWEEAKTRLEEEEKRLRLKAANLQERHGAWSPMAKQELVVADDIRAALERVEEAERSRNLFGEQVRALRQRVEELERADARNKAELRGADDEIKHQARRAKSAEANLARCHGALTDAGSVVVPGTLEGDLAPAIRQLTRERDEARPEVSRLEGLIVALSEDERGLVTAHVHAEADRIRTMRAIAEIARLREALEAVLTESGLQAHKYGCKDRLCRPAQWDEVRPCAGCRAEAALRGGGK